jgi:hypothetical protein
VYLGAPYAFSNKTFITFFFLLISNCNLFKISAEGRNPYTREVYKGAPKRNEQRINLKNLHK